MPSHIILAYSGGLDTSVGVHWLKEHYGAKVTCVMVDLGQSGKDLDEAAARAVANGAESCIVVPAQNEFADQYVAPAIQANALYQGAYPLGTALNRPLIAKALVHVALQVGADAVAHGCTGKGNDQVRIETGVKALAPQLQVLAPQRDFPMTRDEAIRYAHTHGLELPELKKGPYSIDDNLWSRSIEGGDLEDPASPVNEAAYAWTANPAQAPDQPKSWTLTFQNGIPVALNGTEQSFAQIIATLNAEAGAHGVGRIDHVEDRLVGIKSREVYEAPAAHVILAAKKALETLTLTRDENLTKPQLEQKFAQLVYDGLWYSPVMKAINAFVQTIQSNVNGDVEVQAHKGNLTIISRTSPQSLYNHKLATYSDDDQYKHQAAAGFIHVWSLSQETANAVRGAPGTGLVETPKTLATKPPVQTVGS